MGRSKFICLDCKVDTGKLGEHYMLVDRVWLEATASFTGMLCVGCVEARLNRRLIPQDFNDSYLNNPRTGAKSARLMQRMSVA